MLRFIKEHLATAENTNIYGLISLLIFFLFFVVVTYRMWKMKANTISELEAIPFEMDEINNQNTKQ